MICDQCDQEDWRKKKNAWELFIETGRIDGSVVRPVIRDSWIRSREYGVDPRKDLNSVGVFDVSTRLKRSGLLVNAAHPPIQTLNQLVKESGFRIDLTDEEGYILIAEGNEEVLEKSNTLARHIGICRNEVSVGTCGIALALVEDRPIQVTSFEHYNSVFHDWTCSSAPIHDPNGRIVGVLNFAGHCSLIHKHTLGMVAGLARAIELTLKNESTIKAVNTLNMILDLIVREICEGVAVYDDSGKLVHSNPKGSEIISAMVGKVDANTRKRIDSAIDLFELYRDVKDQEACTILDRRRTSFYITTHRIKDDGLKDPGYKCILFKDAEKAQKLSQRMVYGQKPFFTFDDIVGDHDTLTEAIHEARMAAQTDVPILLMGETGTGKEMFAQSIHNASAVSSGPFVALNCAALPAELIESELFGYESGSFTGARKGGKPGKLETADGGTVFLDELDSMPINLQSKLLRVLQTRTVSRIGGEKEIPISIRIVSASKTSLLKQVEKGLFRDDLFFRLNTIVIELPPLRERKSDIPLLCDHFLRRLNARNSKQIRRLSGEASRILMSYDWPGNVRELEGCIERAFVFEKTDHLEPSSLPPHILEHACEPQDRVDPRRLEDYEAALIAETLRESLGNIARAARSLGIGRDTLYRKIRKYEIDVRNHRGLGALSR